MGEVGTYGNDLEGGHPVCGSEVVEKRVSGGQGRQPGSYGEKSEWGLHLG